MTPSEFLDAVRDDNETALSRLGSSKSLYAATGGEMDAAPVLEAAADAEHVAAQTFHAWAADEADDEATVVFETTAAEEDEHADAVLAKLDDYQPDDDATGMQAYLRGLDDTVERAGALLGRILATEKSKEQLTGFFVGQADPQTASVFRDLKGDLDDQRERALELLDDICEDDEDWQTAKDAADAAIQAAYDEYTEQLESMGVNPKPVC
ncbi:rubrerythrin family protein [Halobacterium sp. KA-4]|uniref:rubrerythrin family protein n=1 Tax=Halobacterium sp. KA-4 TaxID=2896367 RepID=UPI001E48392A|nr:rubrerythrin family protein [Halobacterium sp. KA-4]MCD2200508.1 rubrerythrin family protein [Halobacterium sp. KA-4]